MIHLQKSKAFWRYVFSYLFIFLIPFVLFLVIFQLYFVKIYREEVESNLQQKSSQIGSNLDWQLQQLHSIATQVQLSNQFGAAYAENPVHQIEMCQQLHMLQSSNKFIFDLIYYQKNLDTVISSRCIMQRNSIDRIHFSYPQWPLETMLAEIDTLSAAEYRPFEAMRSLNRADVEIMTINIPLSLSEDYNARTLQFQIEKEAFEESLGISQYEPEQFLILNRKGEIVYHSNTVDPVCIDFAREIAFSNSETTQESQGYTAFGRSSSVTDWYYVTFMPIKEVMAKSNQLRIICFGYAGVLLGLSMLAIFWISRRNYRPIQKLGEIARQFSPPPENGETDEIAKAQMAILYLHEFGYNMETKLKQSSVQIQEGLIRRLLQGEYHSIAEFNEEGSPYQICFNSPFLFVAVVSNTAQFSDSDIMKMQRYLSVSCEVYGIRLFQAGHSVLVCGVESIHQKNILELFDQTAHILMEKEGLELWFGISTVTSDPSLLYSKYVEAVSALEYLGNGEPAVLYNSNSVPNGIRYPSEEVETLRRLALEKDETRFLMVYQTLISFIENLKVPLFMRICVSYDVINTLVKSLMELQGEVTVQKFFSENSLAYVEKSGDFSNYIELIKKLRDQICYSLERKENQDALLQQIKAYIRQHYLDPDFSLQNTADHFKMNLPNISAYFKGKTDTTLLQYVTEFKMHYAMELLRTTDFPLSVISEKTGYSTPSSFIRKFKQYSGMTPGDYKKVHGMDDTIE